MESTSRRPVVVVTGGSRGIGLAVTAALLTEFDAIVVALSRTYPTELAQLESAHPDSLYFVECDVTDDTRLTQVVSSVQQIHRSIDALVLNAGIVEPVTRIHTPEVWIDAWRAHFNVNFFSLVTALKAALPALRNSDKGGRVIFISSGAAVKGVPGWGPYNASKAAMNSLCRTLSKEEPNIISVALRPGMVDTSMQDGLRSTGAAYMTAEDHQFFSQVHAEGKLVKPKDVGHVIAALAVKAPKSLSGEFVSWDSEECKEFSKA